MSKFYLTSAFLLLSICLIAQTTILIDNASFEEGIAEPGQRSTTIPGWLDCGPNTETAPDVHSELSDFHNVKHSAAHGFNYLMMVTRDNDTQEMIGSALQTEMKKDSNYVLSVQLAKPATVVSRSKKLALEMEYGKGVILRIFGGNRPCDIYQLLAESPVIEDVDWNEHQFLLIPQRDFDFIYLQAYYDEEAQEPYNGSILLDDIKLSNIGKKHQLMHAKISSDKNYGWQSVLKIDEDIAELVPEGMEIFPGNGDQIGIFQANYAPLLYQYELMNLEYFFTNRGTLVDFIKQSKPEKLLLTIDALRHIHAHRTAQIIEDMYHYFQLQQTSAITRSEAAFQMHKLEKSFSKTIDSDEVLVKRIRHIIAYREKYLTEIRMAMIDLLEKKEILKMVKKNP